MPKHEILTHMTQTSSFPGVLPWVSFSPKRSPDRWVKLVTWDSLTLNTILEAKHDPINWCIGSPYLNSDTQLSWCVFWPWWALGSGRTHPKLQTAPKYPARGPTEWIHLNWEKRLVALMPWTKPQLSRRSSILTQTHESILHRCQNPCNCHQMETDSVFKKSDPKPVVTTRSSSSASSTCVFFGGHVDWGTILPCEMTPK